MFVPEIIEVKEELTALKKKGLIKDWELPYENLLTRRDAAIFFIEPSDEAKLKNAWEALGKFENFYFQPNEKKLLSQLKYEVKFDKKKEEQSKKMTDEKAVV